MKGTFQKAIAINFFFLVPFCGFSQCPDGICYSIPQPDYSGPVIAMHLAGKQLERIDPRLFTYSAIKELNLASNHLSSIPKEIAELKALEILNMPFNRLSSLPAELIELKNLREINLQGNYFSELPGILFEIRGLRSINFGMQKFLSDKTSTIPKHIGNLFELEELNVQFCNIREIPAELYSLSHLRILQLSVNRLEKLDVRIGSLKNLNELYLARNPALAELPESIGQLDNLIVLDLEETGVYSLPDNIFALPSLSKIDLTNTPLSNKLNTVAARKAFEEKFKKAGNGHIHVDW